MQSANDSTSITAYSFVVPAFNEQDNIPVLYDRIKTLMTIHPNLNTENQTWELIFVNDGSTDNTLTVLNKICRTDRRIKYIDLTRNFGHQAALAAGLASANAQAIISLDCDLQDPPEIIAEMIGKWKSGAYVVYARRLNFRNDSFLKKQLSRLYYYLLERFSDVRIPRNVGDFRLIDRKVLNVINSIEGMTPYFRGTVAWTGYKHDFVEYVRPDRQAGEPGYSYRKLAQLAMAGLLNFSFLPLQIGLFIGIINVFVGLSFFVYIILDVLINQVYYELIKYISVALLIFTGFLFIFLWLIAEYIGRIYNEVRNRPVYLIYKKVNFDNPNSDTAGKSTL